MPRVNRTKKSRKTWRCHKCGREIKPGEGYWWWQSRGQPSIEQCDDCGYPKPSQLTGSDKKQRLLKAQEDVQEAADNVANSTADELENAVSELVTALNSAADDIRAVGEEYGEAADNMESAFPSGSSVIDELREKADTCETWATNIDDAVSTIEGVDLDVECGACDGNGTIECATCNGSGQSDDESNNGACSNCDGEGTVECEECAGDGKYIQNILDEVADAVENAMSETVE